MDLNVKDFDGNNGLIAACMEGCLEIVKILVEASTNLNTKNVPSRMSWLLVASLKPAVVCFLKAVTKI